MTTRVPGSTNAVAIVPISDWAPWAGITIADGTPSQPATASRKSANARSG